VRRGRGAPFVVRLALLALLGCGSGETTTPPGSTSSGHGGTAGAGGASTAGASTAGAGTGGTAGAGGGKACQPGETKACYTGPAGTEGVGVCVGGTATCAEDGAGFGPCVGEVTPVPETCDTPIDDDCNGQVNEGCVCSPGSTASCYDGPAGTLGVGACVGGTKTCNAQGTAYGLCAGEVLPATESCATPVDDNCDGQINEGCVCFPSSVTSCYTGPAGTLGVGICQAGTRQCNALGTAYGACTGDVTPQAFEDCTTAVDDDCNGQANEGCVCTPSATTSCYTGPAATQGVGACHAGSQVCNALGTALGACAGEVTPQPESCLTTAVDDNCDGEVNEGCLCAPGSAASCYDGPGGTQGVGACHAGTKTCNAAGTAYGACVGEVTPLATDDCATPVDDNCNGAVNEGCVCVPSATSSCYTGPGGTVGVGPCHAGTQTCNALGTAYGPCSGEVLPQPTEDCTTPDDDNCDGHVNEGCVCAPSSTASCYTGPAGTLGVGVCHAGTQTCNAAGTSFGPCTGEVTPQPESCLTTAVDDNCDGQVNEGCLCTPGSAASCYDGPGGTQGVGPCHAGTQTCNALGTAYGACAGQVTPQAESCNNTVDDDCNGQVNDTCGHCVFSKAWGSAADEEGFSVAADAAGNVFFGGYTTGTVDYGCGPITALAGGGSALVAKLSAAGACLWSKALGDGTSSTKQVATDAAGNLLAAGAFQGNIDFGCGVLTSAGSDDVFVAKLSSAGACLWSKRFGNSLQQITAGLAVDGAGNVLVGGTFFGQIDLGGGPLTSAGNADVWVAKLDASGNHVWSKRFGDTNTQFLRGVARDAANGVLLVGQYAGSLSFGGPTLTAAGLFDAFVAKLDASGNHAWSKSYGDSADQSGWSVTADASSNVIAVGTFAGTVNLGGGPLTSLGGNDAWMVKLDASGNHLWSKALGGAGTQTAYAVAVDGAGYVVATGILQGTADFGGGALTSAGAADVWLGRYDPAGNHLWSKRYGDAATQTPIGIAYDPSGNVLVSGLLMGPTDFGCGPVVGGGGEDLFIAKLSP
jgi:hypothetical protein